MPASLHREEKVFRLRERKQRWRNMELTLKRIFKAMSGMQSEPEGLETFRLESTLRIFLIIITETKAWLKHEKAGKG